MMYIHGKTSALTEHQNCCTEQINKKPSDQSLRGSLGLRKVVVYVVTRIPRITCECHPVPVRDNGAHMQTIRL